jgi:hypothetical protein
VYVNFRTSLWGFKFDWTEVIVCVLICVCLICDDVLGRRKLCKLRSVGLYAMSFESKWPILPASRHEVLSPMYFYPQSRLIAYKGKLWSNTRGLLTKYRMLGIIGQRSGGPLVIMVDTFYGNDAHTFVLKTLVLSICLENHMTLAYSLDRLWAIWAVRRIQLWARRMRWRQRAVAFMMGIGRGDIGLVEDVARLCLAVLPDKTKRCRTFNVVIKNVWSVG